MAESDPSDERPNETFTRWAVCILLKLSAWPRDMLDARIRRKVQQREEKKDKTHTSTTTTTTNTHSKLCMAIKEWDT